MLSDLNRQRMRHVQDQILRANHIQQIESTCTVNEEGFESNRRVTRLRLNPILTSKTTIITNPALHQIESENENKRDSDSAEEDDLRGFHKVDEFVVDDNKGECLNMNDLLHGYLPNNSYESTNMEEDELYSEKLIVEWRLEDVPPEGIDEQ